MEQHPESRSQRGYPSQSFSPPQAGAVPRKQLGSPPNIPSQNIGPPAHVARKPVATTQTPAAVAAAAAAAGGVTHNPQTAQQLHTATSIDKSVERPKFEKEKLQLTRSLDSDFSDTTTSSTNQNSTTQHQRSEDLEKHTNTTERKTPAHDDRYNATLPPLPPSTHHNHNHNHNHNHSRTTKPNTFKTRISSLRHRWSLFSKRRKIIIIAILTAVLIFIIGLSAGLAVRSKSKFSNLPLPSAHGGPYDGELTYYDPGLGACGVTSSSSDFIVAVSHLLYDAVQVGSNPNSNPLCGKKIRASRGGRSVDLTVVDRCTGCKPKDLDVTLTVFEGLADKDLGRVPVSWSWLEQVPGGATTS